MSPPLSTSQNLSTESGVHPATASDTSSSPSSSPPSEVSTPASTVTPPTPISQATEASPASNTATAAERTGASPPSANMGANLSTRNASAIPVTSTTPVRRRTLADYRLGRTLGEGSYSTVVAAFDLSYRRDYAIKVLDKRHIIRENKVKYVNIEKDTLYKLDHPGVVKLYSTFQDNTSLYYVLELCQNGELLTYIKKLGSFDENCTRFYAAQILTAVEYVHSQGVIHRDLKPENILLDQRMYVKLTDFGTAKMLEQSADGTDSDRANSFVGTAEYVSPELLTEKAACKSSDLWALGCIIYQLLAGRPPFKGLNEYQTFQKIVKLEYSFPAGFPADAKDIVSRLLVHDPNERLGANNRIDQLKEHPFFQGINWSTLWDQPAPKLMPYLPPTPTHNTEPLRSDHDTCLYDVNRSGGGLMIVDPFRELGDHSVTSNSSVGDSGSNSISAAEGSESGETDHAHHHRNAGAIEAVTTVSSPLASGSIITAATGPTQAAMPQGPGEQRIGSNENKKTDSAFKASLPPLSPVSQKSSLSSQANGHSKTKSSSGRNAFAALLSSINKQSSSSKKQGSSAKKAKESQQHQQPSRPGHGQIESLSGEGVKRAAGTANAGIARENSSVSLAVTANEISAYSRRSQLELQHELSPCNTNNAFSSWQQQQRIEQWERALERLQLHPQQGAGDHQLLEEPHRLYHHPSLSQDSQNHQQQQLNTVLHPPQVLHPHQHNPQPRRNTGGLDGRKSVSGFLLFRNGSSKNRHRQHQSEQLISPGQGVLPEEGREDDGSQCQHQDSSSVSRSARPSADYTSAAAAASHLHQPQHPHHHPLHQQSNGHNKVDVEKKRVSIASVSASETLSSGPIMINGNTAASSTNSLANGASSSAASGPHSNGNSNSNSNFNNGGIKVSPSPAPSSSTKAIKASKKAPKLRGEILFTASVVTELKGKRCVFIHTTKKSYYFEESNQEGDAKVWVKVLERSMEEWFGEAGGQAHKPDQKP
ncbi:pkb-activating kinase-like protein [Mortierella sp. GBA30]|nr:pkb-activating kinase-like protein [Mortierella sp. GBA30]